MPQFIGLEDYLQPQNIRSVGSGYATETTVSKNLSLIALNGLASVTLKKAFLAAKALQTGGLKTLDDRDPATLSIRERAKFFEENTPANLQKRQAELNAAVIKIRKWLSRQGATFKGDYEINKDKLANKLVKYDSTLERQGGTKVKINGGKFYNQNNQPLDTAKMVTHHSGPGYAIYVLSEQGNFHVGSHKVGQYHHSSLLAGGEVACAGEMKINADGSLKVLSNKSGHYTPNQDDLLHVLAVLQHKNCNMNFKVIDISTTPIGRFSNVQEFLASIGKDNKSIQDMRDYLDKIGTIIPNYGGYGGYGSSSGGPIQYQGVK